MQSVSMLELGGRWYRVLKLQNCIYLLGSIFSVNEIISPRTWVLPYRFDRRVTLNELRGCIDLLCTWVGGS